MLNVNKHSEQTKNSLRLQVILIVVFDHRDCGDKITALLPFKVRVLVNPFALPVNNLLNVCFSS